MSSQNKLSKQLLHWYNTNDLSLPWRNNQNINPYFILLSEFMLQQTQIQIVFPYFIKFIKEFPTIASVALSSQEQI